MERVVEVRGAGWTTLMGGSQYQATPAKSERGMVW